MDKKMIDYTKVSDEEKVGIRELVKAEPNWESLTPLGWIRLFKSLGYIKPSPSEFKVIGDEEICSYCPSNNLCLSANGVERLNCNLKKLAKGAVQAQLTACERVIAAYQDKGLEEGIKEILETIVSLATSGTMISHFNHKYQPKDKRTIEDFTKELLLLFNSQQKKVAGEILSDCLKDELANMTPEYQGKLAHLLNVANDTKFSLAVVEKETGKIILREENASPLF